MRFLFLGLLVFAVGRVKHKLFVREFQMGAVEVHGATLWLTVRDCDVYSVSLKDPLYFSCHFGNIQISIIPAQQRIYSTLINRYIIEVIGY